MNLDLERMPDKDKIEKKVRALRIRQPIGDIYLAVMDHQLLQKITWFDVRRVLRDQRDVETYLGIQRPVNEARVRVLQKYVNFADATFPTAVILAIDQSECVAYDDATHTLSLSNTRAGNNAPDIAFSNLCRVIDGQHRIAGLEKFSGAEFEMLAAIFVGIDISDQAYVFATVNLEQTKVHRSLAFDLFELAKTRSPYKTCHNIAVALDTIEESALYGRIKRLGKSKKGERRTITQSTFVNDLVVYISPDPKTDRDLLLRNKDIPEVDSETLQRYCLRNLFIKGDDIKIGRILQNYFDAVKEVWLGAWDNFEEGAVLSRSNGFHALMDIFGRVYTSFGKPGNVVPRERFAELLRRSTLRDADFSVAKFPPGNSGQVALRKKLLADLFGAEE